jgi:hypothetical protein
MRKTYSGDFKDIPRNAIFVYGANTQGRHGKGSALYAKDHFGAIYGKVGFQNNSYGIVTKNLTTYKHPSVSENEIKKQIYALYMFATVISPKEFYVAYNGIGNNLNGYTPQQMADMFRTCGEIPENIVFEEKFWQLINENSQKN